MDQNPMNKAQYAYIHNQTFSTIYGKTSIHITQWQSNHHFEYTPIRQSTTCLLLIKQQHKRQINIHTQTYSCIQPLFFSCSPPMNMYSREEITNKNGFQSNQSHSKQQSYTNINQWMITFLDLMPCSSYSSHIIFTNRKLL